MSTMRDEKEGTATVLGDRRHENPRSKECSLDPEGKLANV
jgi:hypothetical protein